MGVLKHAILPGFAAMHAAALFACKDLKSWAEMIGLSETEVSEEDEKSIRQNHMLGCLRGANLGFLFLCGMGIFQENAHFRKEIVMAECFFFTAAAVDAFQLGTLNYLIPAGQALIAAAGAIVNSMEPGLFTKDKNS